MSNKKRYFVFACSFFFSLGANILGFSQIYRVTDRFMFTPGQVGFYIAMGQLCYVLGCNLYQYIGSAFNPGRIFPSAVVVVFLASIPLGFSRTRLVVYVAFAILQVSTGSFWPPVMAWLTEGLIGNNLNQVIGNFNKSWMTANLIGPLLAGTLYHWNSGANFLIVVMCYSLSLFFIFLLWRYSRRERRFSYKPEPAAAEPETGAAPQSPVRAEDTGAPETKIFDKRLDLYRYRGWINALSSTLCLGIIGNILPLYIRDGLGYTERSAGMILFFRSLAGLAGFFILARFTFWHFNRRWFIALQGALMFSTLLFLAAGRLLPFYFAIGLFFGLIHSGCYDNSIFYSGATGKNPKKNLALHEIFMSLGSAAGTAGGGLIYQHFRFTGTCIALFLFLCLALGLLVLLDHQEQPGSR
ncbi:MAG: MFS transporter [Treponema sp.]|nr:MFS transporter [Treponema sp.]